MAVFRVKDYGYMRFLMMPFGTFPILFIGIASFLNQNYLLAFFITLAIYTVAFIYFVKYLRKKENEYLIIADEQGVSILKHGNYTWNEISGVNAFSEGFGRSRAHYVKIFLLNGKSLTIEVTNCDYENQDIARKLKEIGKLA